MESLGTFMKITNKIKDLIRPIYQQVLMASSLLKLKTSRTNIAQLEIGSGPAKREGWITLDMCKGADVIWDLRHKLPFDDSCFDKVYCSHVLEHFSYHDLQGLLREVHRVLRPGGQFLIAVPDASIYVDAYMGKRDVDVLMQYKPAVASMKSMDVLNYIFYMDGHHRFMFDAENLAFHCESVGFVGCASRSFDSSLDMAARDYESLYMSCCKQEKIAR
jgi:predicted SAM-dependent methyltransferase